LKLLVHASGYTTVYATDQQEITAVLHQKCGGNPKWHWSPSSKDFAAAGIASGGSKPAGSVDELLNVIRAQAVESIEELRIIAHANEQMFVLAGEVKHDDVYFTKENAWIGPSPAFTSATPQFRDLQDRFTAEARIVLLGCNAGSGKEAVMATISHAFLRKVGGFKEEIKYNFEWGPTGPAVSEKGVVICNRMAPTSHVQIRGRMLYSPLVNQMDDIIGGTPSLLPFKTNAWLLEPDASSNVGDIFIPIRRKDAGVGATELLWRILQEFFPNHVWVSGAGVDTSISGLKVRKEDNHIFIDASPDFARKTTPRTLRNRVAEVGKALELVKAKTAGVVPLT
jgi:hypothetical protein